MRSWDPSFTVEARGDRPRFVQIAQALSAEIRRGRLRPGDALPSSRVLAHRLGVHRNTILAAYAELRAEGWIVSVPARGTFVSQALPDPAPRRFAPSATLRDEVPGRVAFDLPPAIEPFRFDTRTPPGTIALPGGVPDVGLVPANLIARAYRRALQRDAKALLGYRDPAGHPALRSALAGMLSVHCPCDADVRAVTAVPGRLLPVTAAALEREPRLFARNERLIHHLDTALGAMAVVMVAAFGVGHMSCAYRQVAVHPRQIQRTVCDPPVRLRKGDELGVFHLGSTVVLLTRPGVELSDLDLPISVRMGEALLEGSAT